MVRPWRMGQGHPSISSLLFFSLVMVGPVGRVAGRARLLAGVRSWQNRHVTYNFSSGPAALPAELVNRIQEELPDWHGTGMPVMTLSHRGPDFVALMEQDIMQGGGMGQFAAVPLNLTLPGDEVATVVTGRWGLTAAEEAERLGLTVRRVADQAADRYTSVPAEGSWTVPTSARYLYYVPNETIGGVEFPYQPVSPVPLVADASSQILSQPMDLAAHGVVFAGTQKNLGVAGAVVVIVERELLGRARPGCPSILDYTRGAKAGSMLNTPTTFAVYVLDLMLDWVAGQGGVEAMRTRSLERAGLVYSLIDASGFYANPVDPSARSTKNIPFTLADPALDPVFLAESEQAGLAFLGGHRSVGGMRASLYNAMPLAGAQALVDFMRDFERRHG